MAKHGYAFDAPKQRPNPPKTGGSLLFFGPNFILKGWFDNGEVKSRGFWSWDERKLVVFGAWWLRMVMEENEEEGHCRKRKKTIGEGVARWREGKRPGAFYQIAPPFFFFCSKLFNNWYR